MSNKQEFEMATEEKIFSIGQYFDKNPATAIRCKTCKGLQFNVGKGSYFTAVKCVNCGWEVCIHDG